MTTSASTPVIIASAHIDTDEGWQHYLAMSKVLNMLVTAVADQRTTLNAASRAVAQAQTSLSKGEAASPESLSMAMGRLTLANQALDTVLPIAEAAFGRDGVQVVVDGKEAKIRRIR